MSLLNSLRYIKYPSYISLIVPILIFILGDGMYIGLWYYLLIPLVIIGLHYLIFKQHSSFYSGVALGISLSFIMFLSLNWFSPYRPDGMIGLIHLLFALPGMILSIFIFGIYSRSKRSSIILSTKIKSFLSGLFVILFGFIMGIISYYLSYYI